MLEGKTTTPNALRRVVRQEMARMGSNALSKSPRGAGRSPTAGAVTSRQHRGDLVRAALLPGSDYAAAYRPGTPVALQLEHGTGRVLVTIAKGAVKLGRVLGAQGDWATASLGEGYRLSGQIVDLSLGPHGKTLRIRLETPAR